MYLNKNDVIGRWSHQIGNWIGKLQHELHTAEYASQLQLLLSNDEMRNKVQREIYTPDYSEVEAMND
jgi:hypothetical protein